MRFLNRFIATEEGFDSGDFLNPIFFRRLFLGGGGFFGEAFRFFGGRGGRGNFCFAFLLFQDAHVMRHLLFKKSLIVNRFFKDGDLIDSVLNTEHPAVPGDCGFTERIGYAPNQCRYLFQRLNYHFSSDAKRTEKILNRQSHLPQNAIEDF